MNFYNTFSMNFFEISRILGKFLFYFTLILIFPFAFSLYCDFFTESSPPASMAFLETIGVSIACFLLFWGLGKRSSQTQLYKRDSILIVILIWIVSAVLSSLPFLFSHVLQHPIDALFESMSGLTTTGSTILYPKAYALGKEIPISFAIDDAKYVFFGTVSDVVDASGKVLSGVEAIGKPLLLWRALLQWLGGMGIVVLFIALFPALSIGGKFLFEAETTGPNKESLTPRIRQTASFLWKIYVGLTLLQVILLMITNSAISLFDAITLSFCTISTGGFSIYNDGIAAYHHLGTEWVVIVFMFLGGMNFSLFFYSLKGKINRLRDPEFFLYLIIAFLSALFLFWSLMSRFPFHEAIRYGVFQSISALTSTGYTSTSFSSFPFLSLFLMLLFIYSGSMSGSTSGGIKMARHLIYFKTIKTKIESLFRPERITCLKIGDKEISEKTATLVLIFLCVVLLSTLLGLLLLLIDGIDPKTALAVFSSSINNAGIFAGEGPLSHSYAFLPTFSKGILIFFMLFGRLEFFALLMLFFPSFWKKS